MRKWAAIIGGTVAAATMLLAGCGSGAGSSSGTATLTIWWWGQQEAPGAQAWMNQTAKLFEKAHPGVVVKTVLQTTNGLYPAFESAAQAKKGPDLEYLWGGINTLGEAWNGYLTPIDTLIPKSQWSHYLNWQEDYYQGHLWGAPWYLSPAFPFLYNKALFAKAGLNPNNPPQTWSQFLAACAALKAHGITPIGIGAQDGWIGGWLFSVLGDQNLNSVDDLLQAQVSGNIDTPQFTEWLTKLQQLNQLGYINSNAASLQLYQGQALFSEGKVAMTWAPGASQKNFVQALGNANVGAMLTPLFGTGKMAGTLGATSQELAVTSFSTHKKLAAQFILFAHTPARMKAFYELSGGIPADNRFDASLLKYTEQKQLFQWMLTKPDAYIEDFISTQLDSNGNFAGVQDILSGAKTPAQVEQMMQQIVVKWRQQDPAQVANFKNWHVVPWYTSGSAQ